MSWESSAAYYQQLKQGAERRLGGYSSAKTVMASVNFAEVTELGQREDWDGVADILAEAARGVEKAGADFLMLCTTTFHRVAEQVEAAVDIRSEEHTSELQSLMRISYAVFCLKKKKNNNNERSIYTHTNCYNCILL